MSNNIRARKCKIHEKQLEALWQDYEAAITQATVMLGAADRNRVEREAKEIYKKIEKLDSELKSLELAPTDNAVGHDHRVGHSDLGMGNQLRLKEQIDSLQQQWDLLEKRLSALKEQRILETRVEEQLRLDKSINDTKTQRDQIEEQLKEIENRLAKVNSDAQEAVGRNDDQGHAVTISKPDAPRIQEKLRSQLHEIDFKELEKTIEIILRDHRDGGCAALLLFQESYKRGGDWCAARIRKLLHRVTDEGRLREITVRCDTFKETNSMELLRRIGQHLGIEAKSQDSTNSFSQDIVKKLCGSLQNGSVVMIQCQQCDDIFGKIDEFRRILEDFWRNMVSGLKVVSRECCEVKVITLLFTNNPLPDDSLVEYCCTLEQFQKEKLLKLPREELTQEDIAVWIARYSGLPLPPSQIDRMAKNIYESAGGLPIVVEHRLLQECLSDDG